MKLLVLSSLMFAALSVSAADFKVKCKSKINGQKETFFIKMTNQSKGYATGVKNLGNGAYVTLKTKHKGKGKGAELKLMVDSFTATKSRFGLGLGSLKIGNKILFWKVTDDRIKVRCYPRKKYSL